MRVHTADTQIFKLP